MCVVFVLSKVIGLLPTLRGMNVIGMLIEWQSRYGRKTSHVANELHIPGVRRLLTEGRPYALSMFATELFERLDIFLILALGTMQDAGFYFVAVPAAALLTVAPNALGVFTFNAGADRNRKITLGQGVTVMLGITVVQIVSTILFMFMIPFLIVLFYSDAYADAIPFALWLLPACAIKGYLQAVDGYLKGRSKPLIGVWARVLSMFVMLVFVWIAFSSFGLISIPMAACVGQAVSMLIITFAVVREIGRQCEMETVVRSEGIE
jgi:O-antigen/teichoic acid export membrane protein